MAFGRRADVRRAGGRSSRGRWSAWPCSGWTGWTCSSWSSCSRCASTGPAGHGCRTRSRNRCLGCGAYATVASCHRRCLWQNAKERTGACPSLPLLKSVLAPAAQEELRGLWEGNLAGIVFLEEQDAALVPAGSATDVARGGGGDAACMRQPRARRASEEGAEAEQHEEEGEEEEEEDRRHFLDGRPATFAHGVAAAAAPPPPWQRHASPPPARRYVVRAATLAVLPACMPRALGPEEVALLSRLALRGGGHAAVAVHDVWAEGRAALARGERDPDAEQLLQAHTRLVRARDAVLLLWGDARSTGWGSVVVTCCAPRAAAARPSLRAARELAGRAPRGGQRRGEGGALFCGLRQPCGVLTF